MILLSLISTVLSRHCGRSAAPLVCVASVKWACTPVFASVIMRPLIVASALGRSWRVMNMQRIHQNFAGFCFKHSVVFTAPFYFPKVIQSVLLAASVASCLLFNQHTHTHSLTSSPDSQWQKAPLTPLLLCHSPVIQVQTTAIWLLTGTWSRQTGAVPPTQHRERGVAGIKEMGPGGFKVHLTDCHLPIPMSRPPLTHGFKK